MFYKSILILFILCTSAAHLTAQVESDERPLIDVQEGLSFQQEERFLLNLRFRMQNRVALRSFSEDDLNIEQIEARVRRLRLRLDGFVLNKKLQYYIQLSFSRADQDLDIGVIPQTIRDAILYYTLNENFYIGFGQSKLPGNRQRVISSGNQQFAERSVVNAAYNIDRDFGLFAYYTLPKLLGLWRLKGAISTGEGRGAIQSNAGLAYTARLEYLPFGAFVNNGDYSEGDLEFEKRPKVSIAVSYSLNHRAQRSASQLGFALSEERTIHTTVVDALLKYQGVALSFEMLNRQSVDPILPQTEMTADLGMFSSYVPVGTGVNMQASYILKSMTELSSRFSRLTPYSQIVHLEPIRGEALLGISQYLNGHRIKLQGNVGYHYVENANEFTYKNTSLNKNHWLAFAQIEFGI